MRIISGKFRGQKLCAPLDSKIRPTSDRAKEMIFNTLNSILQKRKLTYNNLSVLDCFSGSGSLGIECISRGTENVFFVDKSLQSLNLTKKNCDSIQSNHLAKFLLSDFRNLKKNIFSADLFFLDPPYKKYKINEIVTFLNSNGLIKKKTIGIIEIPKLEVINDIKDFRILKKKINSNSSFLFVEKE
jgi:16S rRNA (guanine(966)-N(2))-methyltransferase RsmD